MPLSVVILIAMTVVVAVLAAWRQMLARNEDDNLHTADPTGQIAIQQQRLALALAKIDRVGIAVTVLTAAYGVTLLATSLYQNFAHPAVQ